MTTQTTRFLSPRKLAANRANARKCTGPRTAAGKARSSMNALKHGLLARSVVIPNDPAESAQEFESLRDALIQDLAPAGMQEVLLVERMAATYWRLRRLYRFEVQSIADARNRADTPLAQMSRGIEGLPEPLPAQVPAGTAFDQLIRYEATLDRTLHRLTLQLARLKTFASGTSDQGPLTNDAYLSLPSTPNSLFPPRTKDQ